MVAITPEQAREYLDRWRLVREAELEELRSTSMEMKLRQLSVLMASHDLFPPDPAREGLAAEVRDRWARIREALRV